MMFDHPMGEPLGSYRKRSRVESAKKLWRVSGTVPSRQCVCACVCKVEVILDPSDAGIMRRIGERKKHLEG